MASIDAYRIEDAPQSMYYMTDFISETEEASILEKIPANRWISLSKRRLQAIPTQLTANNVLLSSKLPSWLQQPVVDRINDLRIFEGSPHGINHCLMNEYLPGQGIMPHEDGSAYCPIVATVSLGGTIVLDVTSKVSHDERPQTWRIVQEPRSLLVTMGSAYTDTLHGIVEVDRDENLNAATVVNWSLLRDTASIEANDGCSQRTTRVSLTLRDVKKVSLAGSKLFGKPK